MDQGSTMKRSAVHNFAPTVTKFCVMWEGQALPHDTKFGNSRCEIVGRRVIFIWSLIHGLRWSGLIKAEPSWIWWTGHGLLSYCQLDPEQHISMKFQPKLQQTNINFNQNCNNINSRKCIRKCLKNAFTLRGVLQIHLWGSKALNREESGTNMIWCNVK